MNNGQEKQQTGTIQQETTKGPEFLNLGNLSSHGQADCVCAISCGVFFSSLSYWPSRLEITDIFGFFFFWFFPPFCTETEFKKKTNYTVWTFPKCSVRFYLKYIFRQYCSATYFKAVTVVQAVRSESHFLLHYTHQPRWVFLFFCFCYFAHLSEFREVLCIKQT